MTTSVEIAERQGTARAIAYLLFAFLILALLLASFGPRGIDYVRGMWVGVSGATLLAMLPLARWLKPNSVVAALLDDETSREHRRDSATAGFWAAMASALALALVTAEGLPVSAFDVARTIATAAMVAALVSFATLELRAARG